MSVSYVVLVTIIFNKDCVCYELGKLNPELKVTEFTVQYFQELTNQITFLEIEAYLNWVL